MTEAAQTPALQRSATYRPAYTPAPNWGVDIRGCRVFMDVPDRELWGNPKFDLVAPAEFYPLQETLTDRSATDQERAFAAAVLGVKSIAWGGLEICLNQGSDVPTLLIIWNQLTIGYVEGPEVQLFLQRACARVWDSPATEVPEWVTDTKESGTFALVAFETGGGDHIQEVNLTRAQYCLLKRSLAALRGYCADRPGPGKTRRCRQPRPAPDWVFTVPSECDYALYRIDSEGVGDGIVLSRDEFVHLKRALALRLGYLSLPELAAEQAA